MKLNKTVLAALLIGSNICAIYGQSNSEVRHIQNDTAPIGEKGIFPTSYPA